MAYYLVIALGGALGAVCRYWLVSLVEQRNTTLLPLGTLAVNILGSLCIGMLFVFLTEKIQLAAYLRPLLVIGFLGAMTTFSTFSLDALLLIEQGLLTSAVFYLVASVLSCLLAAWAGMTLVRLLI